MTAPAQQLLDSFDSLSDTEKKEVAVAILRRVAPLAGDLADEELVVAADELFQTLDAEEAGHGPR